MLTHNEDSNEPSNEKTDSTSTEPAPQDKSLSDLQNELMRWKNDFLYLKAEFENFKKRAVKERSDLLKYGGEFAFLGILTVLDNFERALRVNQEDQNFKSFRDGIELIYKEFKNVLLQFGVVEIDSLGKKFDPSIHEAVGSSYSDDVVDGHIVSVLRNPYKFHDKMIRTGQVIVSTGPQKKNDPPSEE